MTTKIKYTFWVALIGLFEFANFASAQLVPENCRRDTVAMGQGGIDCSLTDLLDLIFNMINYLLGAAGTIALLFLVWGGLKMLLSGGNPEQVKEAKSTITNAIIGFVIILAAYIIINLLVSVLTNGSVPNIDELILFWK